MAGAGTRVGISGQDRRSSPTVGQGGQGGSQSCCSGWRGLLFVPGLFGLPHSLGNVLGAVSALSLLKGGLMNSTPVWSHGAEHARSWCRNSRLSLPLRCSDGMGSVVSGHAAFWVWASGGLVCWTPWSWRPFPTSGFHDSMSLSSPS